MLARRITHAKILRPLYGHPQANRRYSPTVTLTTTGHTHTHTDRHIAENDVLSLQQTFVGNSHDACSVIHVILSFVNVEPITVCICAALLHMYSTTSNVHISLLNTSLKMAEKGQIIREVYRMVV